MPDLPRDPKVQGDPVLHRVLEDVGRTESDIDRFRGDSVLSKDSLFPLVEEGKVQRRLIAYLSGAGASDINLADAAPVGSMLDAIGTCENLDLLLNSPGGSGEAAEKVIEMCRAHCRREFRVIVPNYAKSAATMIALGADLIVMGYLSELGPIDPQYMISVGNVEQYVSGQSFLQAYEAMQEKVRKATAAGESPVGYLQSLSASSMEPAFIEHCRRGVEFSRDVAEKYLPKYQLKEKYQPKGKSKKKPTAKQLKDRAAEAAENLLSKNIRFSHGRLIGGEEARDDVGLNVEVLDRDDPVWEAYWELLRPRGGLHAGARSSPRSTRRQVVFRQGLDPARLLARYVPVTGLAPDRLRLRALATLAVEVAEQLQSFLVPRRKRRSRRLRLFGHGCSPWWITQWADGNPITSSTCEGPVSPFIHAVLRVASGCRRLTTRSTWASR
jgi:hypothetical protein